MTANSPTISAAESPRARPLPDEATLPSEDGLEASLAAYTKAAYLGWSESRYLAADAQWRLGDGTAGFSEEIGVGLLAESIARGTWPQIFPFWSNALSAQLHQSPQSDLSFITSAYVGGEREFAKAQQVRSAQGLLQATALLARSDSQLLLIPNIVTLVADHASPALLQETGMFLASQSPSKLEMSAAVGLVEALLEYSQLVGPQEEVLRHLKEAIDGRIIPSVLTTNAGVFLDSGSGKSDVKTGIVCGTLLVRSGSLLNSPLASAVGRGLIASGLALADEKGMLPATIGFNQGRISSRDGLLAPESIYTILPLARYVPRETSLAAQLGPEAWFWGSARLESAIADASGASFIFSYPASVPYHIVLKGVRPFTQLKLHGIAWHADPSYFKYSDGWAYDADSKTLFMKVTGRAEREQILIAW
jgi:hypothetical protein